MHALGVGDRPEHRPLKRVYHEHPVGTCDEQPVRTRVDGQVVPAPGTADGKLLLYRTVACGACDTREQNKAGENGALRTSLRSQRVQL